MYADKAVLKIFYKNTMNGSFIYFLIQLQDQIFSRTKKWFIFIVSSFSN